MWILFYYSAILTYRGALGSGCPCCWQRRLLHASASLSCPPESAGWASPSECTQHPDHLHTETHNQEPQHWRWHSASGRKGAKINSHSIYAREEQIPKVHGSLKKIPYLNILNNDRKLALCAVSRQQKLTATSEGKELVVKGLEVRLTHHQTLSYTQKTETYKTKENNKNQLSWQRASWPFCQLSDEKTAALVWMCLYCMLHAMCCVGWGSPCQHYLFLSGSVRGVHPGRPGAAQAVLGAASESLHSSPIQPSSTVCGPAWTPVPVWRSTPQQGLAVPLQHRLCQDDCIRPVRRFPVSDLP